MTYLDVTSFVFPLQNPLHYNTERSAANENLRRGSEVQSDGDSHKLRVSS